MLYITINTLLTKKKNTMKKILILIAMLFSVTFFTGCEKEEGPQVLSDFIIGYWYSDTMDDFNMAANFSEAGYILEISIDDTSIIFPLANYSIDDVENQLTFVEPDFEGDGDVDEVTFDVEWTEGVRSMIWTNVDEFDNVIKWGDDQ